MQGQSIRLSLQVYFLAALLIVLATASLVLIGHTASREADRLALESDKRLLLSALAQHKADLAKDQLSFTVWDDAVEHVSRRFDRDFIEEDIFESLWEDFGHDRALIIAPDNQVLAEATAHKVQFLRYALPDTSPLRPLIDHARAVFLANLLTLDGGYAQAPLASSDPSRAASFAVTVLDGTPAFVSAMAIVPGMGEVLLADQSPDVLVSANYVTEDFAKKLNSTLSFRDFRFRTSLPERLHITDQILTADNGDVLGIFSWDTDKPGRAIWGMVVPMVLVLGLILALAAFVIARKIGKLSKSLEESERRNRHTALHDPLTGLANRLQFVDRLNFALDTLPDRGFALIACDLDRFKAINDTYGHAAGDTVICTIARRLMAEVGSDGLVGRIGGDEFLILVEVHTDKNRLTDLAQRILDSVSHPISLDDGARADVGISLGIALAPACGVSEPTLLKAADEALYAAKHGGRDMFVFAAERPEIGLERQSRPASSAALASSTGK